MLFQGVNTWFVTAARGNSYTLSHRLPLSNPQGEATVPVPSSGDSSAHAERMGCQAEVETVRGLPHTPGSPQAALLMAVHHLQAPSWRPNPLEASNRIRAKPQSLAVNTHWHIYLNTYISQPDQPVRQSGLCGPPCPSGESGRTRALRVAEGLEPNLRVHRDPKGPSLGAKASPRSTGQSLHMGWAGGPWAVVASQAKRLLGSSGHRPC